MDQLARLIIKLDSPSYEPITAVCIVHSGCQSRPVFQSRINSMTLLSTSFTTLQGCPPNSVVSFLPLEQSNAKFLPTMTIPNLLHSDLIVKEPRDLKCYAFKTLGSGGGASGRATAFCLSGPGSNLGMDSAFLNSELLLICPCWVLGFL